MRPARLRADWWRAKSARRGEPLSTVYVEPHNRPSRRPGDASGSDAGAMRRALLTLSMVTVVLALLVALPPAPARAAPGWSWPLPGPPEVVRGFDPPAEPWLAGHRGVDLAGRVGEPVRVAGAGTVAFAGKVGGIPVLSVRHAGGLLTTYEPVVADVRVGDAVVAGQRIGRLVERDSHCAPDACLHWGLRRGADYLDPLALVSPTQVRLLPLGHPGGWQVPAAGTSSLGAGSVAAALLLSRRRKVSR
ncbi:MAG: hypothetical protein QOJ03_263 [Frankiaceae bacterium]|nr:hypothetical protein [Frankiaceae bacterium]